MWKMVTSKGELSEDPNKLATTNEEFLEGGNEKYIIYPKGSTQKLKAKIENKVGFLYQVSIEKALAKYYWFIGDNDELQFQTYL